MGVALALRAYGAFLTFIASETTRHPTLETARRLMTEAGRSNLLFDQGLSWPAILVVPVSFADRYFPNHPAMAWLLAELLTLLLSLGGVWGLWTALQSVRPRPTQGVLHLAMACWIVPSMFVLPLGSPSQIAIAFSVFWMAVGAIYKKNWIDSGFLVVGVIAFQKEATPIAITLVSVLISQKLHKKHWDSLSRLVAGLLFGIVVFGIADLLYLGRPWGAWRDYFSALRLGTDEVSGFPWIAFPVWTYGLYHGIRRQDVLCLTALVVGVISLTRITPEMPSILLTSVLLWPVVTGASRWILTWRWDQLGKSSWVRLFILAILLALAWHY